MGNYTGARVPNYTGARAIEVKGRPASAVNHDGPQAGRGGTGPPIDAPRLNPLHLPTLVLVSKETASTLFSADLSTLDHRWSLRALPEFEGLSLNALLMLRSLRRSLAESRGLVLKVLDLCVCKFEYP